MGGGDSACEEAIFLTKYASKVYMLHRRDKLRASKVMADRAMQHPKIEILWNKVPLKAKGDSLLKSLEIQDTVTKEVSDLEVNGLFYGNKKCVNHQLSDIFLIPVFLLISCL